MTTANYILKAVVDGEVYIFPYDDLGDVWEALDEFYHEDYPEVLIDKGGGLFPIDVIAMDGGKAIRKYEFEFNAGVFHAFFDKGHTASGTYTLDQFAKDIERKSDGQKNDVTSFMFYMWNRWSEEECKIAFKDGDYNHFWNKWCEAYDTMNGPRGAAELFYMMLSDTNRDKLVKRALECYDGQSEKQ